MSAVPMTVMGWALVLGFTTLIRLLAFEGYAHTWDGCEFVWAVTQGYLPHGPYIAYLWAGLALARVMPADVALSLLSFVSGITAALILGMVVRRREASDLAGMVAAGLFAAMPGSVEFSATQEVYALLIACLLGTALLAGRAASLRGAIGAGLLFGTAVATHDAALFLAPAIGLELIGATAGTGRLRRLAAFGGAALVVPAAALAWLVRVIPAGPPAEGATTLSAVIRGIAPVPLSEGRVAGLADAHRSLVGVALSAGWPVGVLVGVWIGAAVLLALRRPSSAAFWGLWAAPYLAYELAIGQNLDHGLYVPFVLPSLAAMTASTACLLVRPRADERVTFRAVRYAAVAAMIALLGVSSASAALGMGGPAPSRSAYLATPLLRELRRVQAAAPPNAYVVQPPRVWNVNLAPAYGGRRPIILEEGRWEVFVGRPWAPLAPASFLPLNVGRLHRMVEAGLPILSLAPDPFPPIAAAPGAAPLVWVEEPLGDGTIWRLRLGEVRPAAGPAG
jgi:hypothetical protein